MEQNYQYYQLPCIDGNMTGTEWKLFTLLFDKLHNQTEPLEIAMGTLAYKMMKTTRTIQRVVKRLETIGVINVERSTNGNKFSLNYEKINRLSVWQCGKEYSNSINTKILIDDITKKSDIRELYEIRRKIEHQIDKIIIDRI